MILFLIVIQSIVCVLLVRRNIQLNRIIEGMEQKCRGHLAAQKRELTSEIFYLKNINYLKNEKTKRKRRSNYSRKKRN